MHFEIKQGKDGQWYWHLVARNGKIVADGAEGYTRPGSCKKACKSVRDHLQGNSTMMPKPIYIFDKTGASVLVQ